MTGRGRMIPRLPALGACAALLFAAPLWAQTDDTDILAEEEIVVPAPARPAAVETAPPPADGAADAGNEAGPEPEKPVHYTHVRLQGLNKVTARTSDVEAPIGVVTRFGNLELIARACHKSAPEERPENTALLEIWELRPNESPKRIFNGWMFSSSPSVSALEHAVYDIVVLECLAEPIENP